MASGTSTYYSYIWYATSGASAADTITAAFSAAVTGSVSIYELYGVSTTGPTTAVGSSQAGSTALAVASFTPGANSIVIGNAETATSTSAFTAGAGYTLAGTCAVVYGCGESQTGVGLGLFQFDSKELMLIPALVVLASLVGFLPAVSAYRTDVAKALAGSR